MKKISFLTVAYLAVLIMTMSVSANDTINDISMPESTIVNTTVARSIDYYWMCNASNVNVYAMGADGTPNKNKIIGLMQKGNIFRTTKGGTTSGMLYGYPHSGDLANLFGNVYSATTASYYTFGGTDLS